jgi:3-phosphoshikimate 1-carboxyvinyltransferase
MTKNPRPLPDRLEIRPLTRPAAATVVVPGSKSITNRALVLAALACGDKTCVLRGALFSEDTEVCVTALQKLGFEVLAWHFEDPYTIEVVNRFPNKLIPADQADLFVANSGTTMRFLTALVSLGHGRFRLDGVARMRERPIADLLDALNQLGVRADSEHRDGFPPVIVQANGLSGGRVQINGDVSSQFLSGLLMVAPYARQPLTIEVTGPLVSRPYVDMTSAMMRQFGADVDTSSPLTFKVRPDQRYHGISVYEIEPDASAASYFFAAAAVTGGRITVPGLGGASLQGDVGLVDLLGRMGCAVERQPSGITVQGGSLHGIDVDMNDISDTVMTLAAVACFAEGPTTIRNVAHIRHKETDRLQALATELRRLGAEVDEFADGLTITPRPLQGATVQTYNDHRMAMSLALVGLRVPGVVIHHPACVAKTYPDFFADLERLRASSPDRLSS